MAHTPCLRGWGARWSWCRVVRWRWWRRCWCWGRNRTACLLDPVCSRGFELARLILIEPAPVPRGVRLGEADATRICAAVILARGGVESAMRYAAVRLGVAPYRCLAKSTCVELCCSWVLVEISLRAAHQKLNVTVQPALPKLLWHGKTNAATMDTRCLTRTGISNHVQGEIVASQRDLVFESGECCWCSVSAQPLTLAVCTKPCRRACSWSHRQRVANSRVHTGASDHIKQVDGHGAVEVRRCIVPNKTSAC